MGLWTDLINNKDNSTSPIVANWLSGPKHDGVHLSPETIKSIITPVLYSETSRDNFKTQAMKAMISFNKVQRYHNTQMQDDVRHHWVFAMREKIVDIKCHGWMRRRD